METTKVMTRDVFGSAAADREEARRQFLEQEPLLRGALALAGIYRRGSGAGFVAYRVFVRLMLAFYVVGYAITTVSVAVAYSDGTIVLDGCTDVCNASVLLYSVATSLVLGVNVVVNVSLSRYVPGPAFAQLLIASASMSSKQPFESGGSSGSGGSVNSTSSVGSIPRVGARRAVHVMLAVVGMLLVFEMWGGVWQASTSHAHDADLAMAGSSLHAFYLTWAYIALVGTPLVYAQLLCAAVLFRVVVSFHDALVATLVQGVAPAGGIGSADDAWAAYLRVEAVVRRQARAWQTLLATYIATIVLFMVSVVAYLVLYPGWDAFKALAAAPWTVHMFLVTMAVRYVARMAQGTPRIVMELSRRRCFDRHERFRLQRNMRFNPIAFPIHDVVLDQTTFLGTLFAMLSTVVTAALRALS